MVGRRGIDRAMRWFASVYGQWKPKSDLTLQIDLGNIVNGSSATLRDV